MDWETVQRVRQAQQSAQNRIDDQLALNNELMQTLLATGGAKRDNIPALTELETMIFRMKTQLIDYIVEHGLVQGFIFDGTIQAIKGGNIEITAEMISDVVRKSGFPNMDDILNAVDKILADGSYVSDPDYVHTDNNFTTDEKNKLAGIADGAEVNAVIDVTLNGTSVLDGADRVAKITITEEDIKAWYESNPNTNAFTDADKIKLDALNIDAEPNRVDDVLVDDRSVVNANKQAIITNEIIKTSYESNPNTNAFTDEEKEHLQDLFEWKPEAIERMNDIERKHDSDIVGLDGKFTAQYQTLSTQLLVEHDRITHVEIGVAENEKEIIALGQKHSSDITDLNGKIDANKQNITAINDRLITAESTITEHDNEINDLNKCCTDVGERLATISTQIINLSSQIATISGQVLKTGTEIAKINDVITGISTEQGEMMADITSMKQDIQDVTQKADDNETDIAVLQADVSTLQTCCHTVSSQIIDLGLQINAMDSRVSKNTNDISNINDVIREIEKSGLRLVWENPSSGAFPEQQIDLGVIGGEYFTIVAADGGYAKMYSMDISQSNAIIMSETGVGVEEASFAFSFRTATYFRETGIMHFSSAYGSEYGTVNAVENNNLRVPVRIYEGVVAGSGTGGSRLRMLWENPNPFADYDDGIADLTDAGDGLFFAVLFRDKTSKAATTVIAQKGRNEMATRFTETVGYTGAVMTQRSFSTYNPDNELDYSKIKFYPCKTVSVGRGDSTAVADPSSMIPYRVYDFGFDVKPYDDRQMVTLWENPDPTQIFEPQNIQLDLSSYDYITVIMEYSYLVQKNISITTRVGDGGMGSINAAGGGNFAMVVREFGTNESLVGFANAYIEPNATDPNNEYVIPVAIIGIRGTK